MDSDPHRATPAPNVNTLSDIVRGIQHSVNTAQEIIEEHYIRMLQRYFEPDGSPLSIQLQLTPEHIVNAPLIALIHPNALSLDEMTVEMSIDVESTEVKKVPTPARDIDLERSGFTVAFASGPRKSGEASGHQGHEDAERSDNVIDIVMKFKRGDTPEGLSRILDEFYKTVVARPAPTEPREVPTAPRVAPSAPALPAEPMEPGEPALPIYSTDSGEPGQAGVSGESAGPTQPGESPDESIPGPDQPEI